MSGCCGRGSGGGALGSPGWALWSKVPGQPLVGSGRRRGRGPGGSLWGPGGRRRWIWREAPRQAVLGSDAGFSQRLVLGPQGFSEGTARNGQRPVKPGQWRPGGGVLTPVRSAGPAETGCSPGIPRRKRNALPGYCPSRPTQHCALHLCRGAAYGTCSHFILQLRKLMRDGKPFTQNHTACS